MKFPGILVLGTPEVEKWPIASQILQDQQQNITQHPPADVHQWHINTKYYKATTQIEIHHLDDNFLSTDVADHIQAVVMVFNPTSPSSFTHLKSWWQSLLKNNKNPNLDIPIKLIIPSPPISQLQQWHTDGVLHWSATQMIEYIDHGITITEEEKEEEKYGGGISELRGINRLIEALHSHMWPGLERKNIIKNSETTSDSGGGVGEDIVKSAAVDDPLLLDGDDDDDDGDNDDEDSGDNINKMFAEMYALRDRVGTSSYEERRDMVGSIGRKLMAAIGMNMGDVLVDGSDDYSDDSDEEAEGGGRKGREK